MKRKYSEKQQQHSNVRDLLTRGVAAAKAGEKKEAHFYLEWVLIAGATEDQAIEAWLWLAHVSEGHEKRGYLEDILSRRPAHAQARRELAILDGRLKREEIVDPESLPTRAGNETAATGRQFTCPRCASRMVFTPDGASLHCEHCGYRQVPQAGGEEVQETDFIVTMATTRGHSQPISTATFSCRSCAASFLLPPGTLTVTCPYCHHTYAVESAETRDLVPPQAVLPFVLDEARAVRVARRWLAEHNLRPSAEPHGIYLPAWTFDVGGTIDWQGQVSTYEEDTRSWRTVSGNDPLFVDDVVVPACSTLPREVQPLLQTFDLDALVPYDEDYLAAWPAQTYEIAVGDASLAARKVAYKLGRKSVRRSHRQLSALRFSSAGITIISYKLILLPVWLAHYGYDEHTYALAINGQNGRLLAQREPSPGLLGGVGRWFDKLLGKGS